MVGAFVFEAARVQAIKEKNFLAQALATGARNGCVTSALEVAYPSASKSQIATMTRYSTLLMEGRLSQGELRSAAQRDAFIARVKRENPDLGAAADFGNFLYELQQQRR